MDRSKYLEFHVTLDKDGKIIGKKQTSRGHVSISQFIANDNNSRTDSTYLYYELAEKEKPVAKKKGDTK